MANPQKENGFTPISNELLEKIYQSKFLLREIRTILAVIRFTYGFNRKSAELSLTFLSQATKIQFRHIQSTVKNLISKNVLLVVNESKGIHSRKIKLNKNYDNWELALTKSVNTKSGLALTKSDNTIIDQKSNTTIDQSSQPRKKTIKKTIKKRAETFSIDNIPLNLNGQLFHKNNYFYITTDFKNELLENIAGLSDDQLKIEFYKMQTWLEKNGNKKDYKRFIVNWLSRSDNNGNKRKVENELYDDF